VAKYQEMTRLATRPLHCEEAYIYAPLPELPPQSLPTEVFRLRWNIGQPHERCAVFSTKERANAALVKLRELAKELGFGFGNTSIDPSPLDKSPWEL
jgi:hypothetical protein